MTEKHNTYFKAFVGPFMVFNPDYLEESFTPSSDFIKAINKLSSPNVQRTQDWKKFINDYKNISTKEGNYFVSPCEENIMDKLIWPLRNAKICYSLGNYLGTIALCGVVSEMISILFYEISPLTINGQSITKDQEEKIFGREFENLGQERRVAVLNAYNIISKELEGHFNKIRNIRKKYLHFYSKDHNDISKDALQAYESIFVLLSNLTCQGTKDGMFIMNPKFTLYLEKLGLIEQEILKIKSLKLVNKGTKTNRELALHLENFSIYSNQITFILGDRGAGKSPLQDVIEKIMNNNILKLELKETPEISKIEDWKFQNLNGDPDNWKNLHSNTLYFCDDPNHNHKSTGSELIKKANIENISLIISVDPDRLPDVFKSFLECRKDNKIIWLSSGKIFWHGNNEPFISIFKDLLDKYKNDEEKTKTTDKFLDNINKACSTL
ncbi:MAG: hypothetical protein ACD_79C01402G0003 [uncultured bacterium]|nr:MAG: hypothetical protein ACD_79C01402G0003 [uncultured bacterium]